MKPWKASVLALFFALSLPGFAFAALSDYFVDTAWLADNIERVKVVDVRVTPLYLLGHIDGAIHIDKNEFLFSRNGVKSLIPTVEEFESLMDRFGITPDTVVVAYAEDHNPYSARFVWMLRYHGHAQSYVLDGGYDKWNQEDRPTALLPTRVVATEGYRCRAGQDVRADSEDVLTRLANPSVVVWDTRRTAEHEGSEVRAERAGHIPGARHLDWVNLQKEVNGVKVLKSEQEIRALLELNGLGRDRQVIAHCQTGIRSSYATLVLLGLGYTQAKNYDGSWIEWANNPVLPIDTGAGPAGTTNVAQDGCPLGSKGC
ncbi:MAG TPA: sulfurtransferase [Desulfuromonadales bacterium]|nr:sulfurtransferase [Desulfuromonadales bacterium]